MNKGKRNWQEMRMEILPQLQPLSGLREFYEILPFGPCGSKLGLKRLARMLTKCWKK